MPAQAAAWLYKPEGVDYDSFRGALARLSSVSAVWQREMVLGPAPEFCVEGVEPADLEWPVAARSRRKLVTMR